MLFENVALVKVSAVDAPHRIASRVIMSRLRATEVHKRPTKGADGADAKYKS